MKFFATLLVVALSTVAAWAQNPQMNQQNMQQLMEEAMKAQACMQQIDQNELQKLEQEANAFEAELRKLCAAGKRDKAQKKAVAFGKSFSRKPVLKQMKKCNAMMEEAMGEMGEIMPGMMPEQALMDMDYEKSGGHVCDELSD